MAETLSHFGGVAGDVLRRALRGSTWVSGMALVSALFLTARGLGSIEQPGLFPVAAMLIVSLGLAYHGVRAAAANASSLKTTDGRTLVVATRMAIASAVWLVPWMLWGASGGRTPELLDSIGVPSPLAAGLYLFGCLVATPICLIAAVHSKSWIDVLSPVHWGHQFSGRGNDLMVVYTIQTGGAALAAALMTPLVFGAIRLNTTAGFAATAVAACVVLGYWVSLTGRLCGSIHAAPAEVDPVLDAELNRDLSEPVSEEPRVDEPPVTEDRPRDPQRKDDAEHGEGPIPPKAAKVRRYAAPSKPVAFEVPKPVRNVRKTPLLDAETRVKEAMKRFRLDPSYTLSKLAELNQKFSPSAHVLQSLAICLHRTGHIEHAFKAARQAFPLCFERGYTSLAAALFYELRTQLNKLDLRQSQVLEIATVLQRADELAAAAKAYSLVIHTDPREILAIKGLLDVAERILKVKRKPAAALKVYRFLLEHQNDAGMAEVIRDGIEQCHDAEEAAENVEQPDAPARV
ncbi:MAG: hypothetical protein V3S47_00805 [Acidobacteriota bacterium]